MKKMSEKRKEWYAREFEEINKSIRSKGNIPHYEFLRIKNYKARALSEAKKKEVEEQTKKAFKAAKKGEIETAIKALTELHGVGIATASAMLAMRYPERYAIVDKRVVNALKREFRSEYKTGKNAFKTPKGYREYLEFMRKKAKKKKKKLRVFERELFEKETKK